MSKTSCRPWSTAIWEQIWEQSTHAQNLMTSMVYCDLGTDSGTEHPCPNPTSVLLWRPWSTAIREQSIHVQNLKTSMVYCDLGTDLGTEHPCPKPNDVHGLLRVGNRFGNSTHAQIQRLMTSMVYGSLEEELPCQCLMTSAALLFENRAPMSKT